MKQRLRRLIDRWAPMVSQDDPQAISRLDRLDGVGQTVWDKSQSHDKESLNG